MMINIFLFSLTWGQEIYMTKTKEGVIKFTDSPKTDDYVVFDVDGPPPKKKHISKKNFPKLNKWDDMIIDASLEHNVPAELIKAICLAESGMNPNAKSRVGAMGLMQLMPATAKGLKVKDPWDPKQNIAGGSRYIAKMITQFGNYRHALAAYNAGPGNVIKYKGIPPFKETKVYVKRVMDLYQMFLTEKPITP